jgi:hypothetical protein
LLKYENINLEVKMSRQLSSEYSLRWAFWQPPAFLSIQFSEKRNGLERSHTVKSV